MSRFLEGLWDILGQEEAGSVAARAGTLPVALASLLDNFDRLDGIGGLLLSPNPWEHPPEAFVTGGMRAVRQYFEAIYKGGTTAVTRPLKVVILGKETVGKTRQMTFRVPDANVVLVGNKWDLVAEAKQHVAVDVERVSREWLTAWIESAHGHQPPQLSLEAGVSLSKPGQRGLLRRIIYNPVDDTRAVTMRLPPGYVLALKLLGELSCSRSEAGQQTRVMTRASLEEEWKVRVDALDAAGTKVAASEAAMSGAILIRKWEGGLVEYGNYIFLDVGWFADVLDLLFSHKLDSNGIIHLGGKTVTVTDDDSLKRLHTYHIFEPRLALNSAGLTFPIPNDPFEVLVVVLRMDTNPPPDYDVKVEEEQARKYYDLRLVVQCSFRLGLPPGFVERLLARCCQLGFPHPFWRYGALVVGDGAEEGKFSLTLEHSEDDKTLKVEVNGRCDEVHAWATLAKVLSVTIKMLSEFPGLPCQLEFICPRHEDKGMCVLKANARPGSRLVEQGHFCPLCPDRTAGNDLLGVALQVVEYSDTEFSDAQLREQFADNAKRVARQGRALWPALVLEVQAPNHGSPDRQTPLYRDLKAWVAAATLACFAIFGVFAGKDDGDSRIWGVFLGLGIFLSGAEFVLIAKHYEILCFKRKEGVGAGNEHGGEERAGIKQGGEASA
ncbi:LRR-GTPase of the ROCO family, putative pseudogene [Ectocarpus siliculosus]|nr:LRR-GTPase of the ROCO family, putative pseudogene [Ectocarpus siliculosus]|eukprot:CBJ48810.1 LRR-GTPase of the ROCO family, putative pseudogene [Ectocarpus siliculosus]